MNRFASRCGHFQRQQWGDYVTASWLGGGEVKEETSKAESRLSWRKVLPDCCSGGPCAFSRGTHLILPRGAGDALGCAFVLLGYLCCPVVIFELLELAAVAVVWWTLRHGIVLIVVYCFCLLYTSDAADE